jgi:very-short-patch-repair endonuclease
VKSLRLTEEQFRELMAKRAPLKQLQLKAEVGRRSFKGGRLQPSKLEETFARQIALLNLPMPLREYRFYEERKWRFDFAWPDLLVAVEVDGMVHRIKQRFNADIEKHAMALLLGWKVLRVNGTAIRSGDAATWAELLVTKAVGQPLGRALGVPGTINDLRNATPREKSA